MCFPLAALGVGLPQRLPDRVGFRSRQPGTLFRKFFRPGQGRTWLPLAGLENLTYPERLVQGWALLPSHLPGRRAPSLPSGQGLGAEQHTAEVGWDHALLRASPSPHPPHPVFRCFARTPKIGGGCACVCVRDYETLHFNSCCGHRLLYLSLPL